MFSFNIPILSPTSQLPTPVPPSVILDPAFQKLPVVAVISAMALVSIIDLISLNVRAIHDGPQD